MFVAMSLIRNPEDVNYFNSLLTSDVRAVKVALMSTVNEWGNKSSIPFIIQGIRVSDVILQHFGMHVVRRLAEDLNVPRPAHDWKEFGKDPKRFLDELYDWWEKEGEQKYGELPAEEKVK